MVRRRLTLISPQGWGERKARTPDGCPKRCGPTRAVGVGVLDFGALGVGLPVARGGLVGWFGRLGCGTMRLFRITGGCGMTLGAVPN